MADAAPKKRRRRRGKQHVSFLNEHRHLYDELLEAQGGGCAICGRPPSPRRRLDMDHDHKLMRLRGLLCPRCNRAIPSWMTPDWLKRAAEYVGMTLKFQESLPRENGHTCSEDQTPNVNI